MSARIASVQPALAPARRATRLVGVGRVTSSPSISTTSVSLLLEMLRRERVLSLVPRSLIELFVQWGLVARVAFELDGGFEGIGALLGPESDGPAVAACLAAVQEVADGMGS